MYRFEEVSLAEQEQYIYENARDIANRKTILLEKIRQIEDNMGKYLGEVGKLRALVENNQVEEMYTRCAYLTKRITNIVTSLGILPAEYGIKDKKEYINRVVVNKKNVTFIRKNNELRIILPELLPHRPQYDTVSKSMKYMYDIDQWRAGYHSAFAEEFMHGKYKLFGEKVCMIFLHHVDPDYETDIDNLEYKTITDIVTLFLLVDDSHRYVSHYMDMMEDGGNYTEIIICPQRKMYAVLNTGLPKDIV